ncbi:MAG TPA: DUF4328 domain-containing protein [Candidatus Acidoferrales bacterium]|nr:DUF4328 domain-containing protein [Candidatus Acidoferrales bacterium]
MTTRTFTRDPEQLTAFLKVMLWILLGTTVLSLGSDLLQFQLLNSGRMTMVEAEANDSRQQIMGVIHLLVYVVTGVAFLRWIHRANTNVRGFGATELKFTPGWSVGYYFIPFLNLVRPYRAMKEIWQASKNPDGWNNEPAPPLLSWWWGLLLISGFLGQASLRLALRADDAASLSTSTIAALASGLVDIPLCLVAIKLVTDIMDMQRRVVSARI